ncbi:DUF3105 domain-containing protein [Nocardioides sp. AE5]|uniref:DUF3105 domain-containing protein n=1 Tax=Nocardioides sp. AE5 TaxID=2962573 RepID=UPI002881B301|nr:DUF3105 domain-containing protein [Nocardioides sp. AE5]MDT0201396.1 DUF3105 domain-containing protein [Nocardioides sp. AE5]
MRILRLVLVLAIAAVLVTAAVLLPILAGGDDPAGQAQMGPPNGSASVAREAADIDGDDLGALREYPDLSTWHVDPDETVTYDQTPPAGGEHAGHWLECGVYDEPVREENAVHALEHGTVWITYQPDLSDAEVSKLAELLPTEGILSPYPGLRAPVVVTVWGTQLDLVGADDPRLATFIERYGNGETAPEPMASCHGGVVRYESEDSQGP